MGFWLSTWSTSIDRRCEAVKENVTVAKDTSITTIQNGKDLYEAVSDRRMDNYSDDARAEGRDMKTIFPY